MLFNELGLSAELLRAVDEKGYREATPIQIKVIPLILEGRDILAGAQTGTGKTAGFMLPLLQHLQKSTTNRRSVRALILTPTRELAAQVAESARVYGNHLRFRSSVIVGGVSINTQIAKLRKGADIAMNGAMDDKIRVEMAAAELATAARTMIERLGHGAKSPDIVAAHGIAGNILCTGVTAFDRRSVAGRVGKTSAWVQGRGKRRRIVSHRSRYQSV